MTVNLSTALVYDLEMLPNVFLCCMSPLYGDGYDIYEISEFRDDRAALMQRLNYIHQHQIATIGFNNEGYDYPLLHLLLSLS